MSFNFCNSYFFNPTACAFPDQPKVNNDSSSYWFNKYFLIDLIGLIAKKYKTERNEEQIII
jgi:hypothetical protein